MPRVSVAPPATDDTQDAILPSYVLPTTVSEQGYASSP